MSNFAQRFTEVANDDEFDLILKINLQRPQRKYALAAPLCDEYCQLAVLRAFTISAKILTLHLIHRHGDDRCLASGAAICHPITWLRITNKFVDPSVCIGKNALDRFK